MSFQEISEVNANILSRRSLLQTLANSLIMLISRCVWKAYNICHNVTKSRRHLQRWRRCVYTTLRR